MARYDVVRLNNHLVVDVQTDHLTGITTRLVIPLEPIASAPRRTPRLNPVLTVAGQPHVLMTQEMASVPAKWLTDRIGSLLVHADDIADAIDVLLTGF